MSLVIELAGGSAQLMEEGQAGKDDDVIVSSNTCVMANELAQVSASAKLWSKHVKKLLSEYVVAALSLFFLTSLLICVVDNFQTWQTIHFGLRDRICGSSLLHQEILQCRRSKW